MNTSAEASGASELTVSFHGGAGTVTGSRHLLTAGGTRLLIDCGMFQGLKELRELNWRAPAFDPGTVDAMILTHAHMDHVGYVPRLVREGYGGSIYATRASAELGAVVLLDSAKIQEEDAARAARKGYSKHNPPQPLYTMLDVDVARKRFSAIEYGNWLDLGGVRARLHNAGHILGSAMVEVEAPGPNGTARIVFSGDIGRYSVPLHSDPDPLPACDALVIESTYGNRVHSAAPLPDQIRVAFVETINRGGTILIPSFAMARTQLVTLLLGELMASGKIPRVPVHVDSPMAITVTKIYNEHLNPSELDSDLGTEQHSMLLPPGTMFCESVEESKALNRLPGPRVIIASSGMLTGGRVLHHLERLAPDPKNLIVLVGYQAPGTRGRLLVDGARSLRMYGAQVPMNAKVLSVDGMSGHADSNELMRWLRSGTSLPRAVFVVHGEPASSAALAQRITAETGVKTYTPKIGDHFDLGQMLAAAAT